VREAIPASVTSICRIGSSVGCRSILFNLLRHCGGVITLLLAHGLRQSKEAPRAKEDAAIDPEAQRMFSQGRPAMCETDTRRPGKAIGQGAKTASEAKPGTDFGDSVDSVSREAIKAGVDFFIQQLARLRTENPPPTPRFPQDCTPGQPGEPGFLTR
jgi:hypothetical protein